MAIISTSNIPTDNVQTTNVVLPFLHAQFLFLLCRNFVRFVQSKIELALIDMGVLWIWLTFVLWSILFTRTKKNLNIFTSNSILILDFFPNGYFSPIKLSTWKWFYVFAKMLNSLHKVFSRKHFKYFIQWKFWLICTDILIDFEIMIADNGILYRTY